MSSNKNLIQALLAFAKSPSNKSEKINPKNNFVSLWSVMFLSSMCCVMITSIVVLLMSNDSHKMSGFINNLPAWKIVIYAIIIGPLVEELAFRLPLKLTKLALSYGIAFLAIFCFTMFFQSNYEHPVWLFDYTDWRGILSFAVVATLIASIFLSLFQIKGVFSFIELRLSKYYNVWFYTILILFAAIHILNFENIGTIWFIAPLLILPQLSLSFFLGFIRVKMGFSWAYLAHFLNNGFMIGLMLLMKSVSPLLVEVMSNFDFSILQNMLTTDFILFGLINLLFFGFLGLVCYYALIVIVEYLQLKSYTKTKQLKIARTLSMILPGLGQDYLQQKIAAKNYYKYFSIVIILMIVPLAIPFTYTSLNNALVMFALPLCAYIALTYFAVKEVKKSEV